MSNTVKDSQRTLFACLLLFWWPIVGWADFEAGVASYEHEDYGAAFQAFTVLAKQGHVTAQLNLGYMYSEGQGVPQDYAEAARWYRNAAQQGDAIAQYKLGLMYERGQGVVKNHAEAVRWYKKATDDSATAESDLDVPQDPAEAVVWYRAYAWFNVAATAGDKEAPTELDIVLGDITPSQLEAGPEFAAVEAVGKDSPTAASVKQESP